MKIVKFKKVSSTQDIAKKLAERNIKEVIVVAEEQTSGRGRYGRTWFSPIGGLWFSILLRPNIVPMDSIKLMALAGLAITKAIRDFAHLPALIKWPNDVYINDKKICGILIESSIEDNRLKYIIIGIGLNVNNSFSDVPPNILKNITSLRSELGKVIDKEALFKIILKKFKKLYNSFINENFNKIIEEYKKYSFIINKDILIKKNNEIIKCKVLDIGDDYSLIVKKHNGEITKFSYEEISKIDFL
jgi:BirA family biotin operon repressor/biotin-[acetyl-CoA-carboxylase] ligase